MIEPKKKAIDLIFSFDKLIYLTDQVTPIDCALLCVENIISALKDCILQHKEDLEYWENVKLEIEKYPR